MSAIKSLIAKQPLPPADRLIIIRIMMMTMMIMMPIETLMPAMKGLSQSEAARW